MYYNFLMTMISFKGIYKNYKHVKALKNVSFDIAAGDRVALVGSNGSGKSTTVNLIVGMQKPTKGYVSYGMKFTDFKAILGVQFQDQDFPHGLKIVDLIKYYCLINNTSFKSKRTQDLIDKLKLRHILKSQVKYVSGGQKQKVNILLCIINNPKVLIFDELTNALDIAARAEIKEIIKDIIKEKDITLINVTHDIHEIRLLCNRLIFFRKGEVIVDNTIPEIEKKWKSLENFFDKELAVN